MTEQGFSSKGYSLSPIDLLPPDEGVDDEEQDYSWQEYCRIAATVDRQHILECVLSDLNAADSSLFEFIDAALREPHEPGRARDSLTKLAQLGQYVLNLIAKAVDDQVGLKIAVEVPHVL